MKFLGIPRFPHARAGTFLPDCWPCWGGESRRGGGDNERPQRRTCSLWGAPRPGDGSTPRPSCSAPLTRPPSPWPPSSGTSPRPSRAAQWSQWVFTKLLIINGKLPQNETVYWPLQMLVYYKSASSCCYVLLKVFLNTKTRQIILLYQLIGSFVSCLLLWFVRFSLFILHQWPRNDFLMKDRN